MNGPVAVVGIACLGVAVLMVWIVPAQRSSAAKAEESTPAQWSVSKGYTTSNKIVPGMMIASVDGAGDRGEISVRCAPGLSGVYVRPAEQPASEPGTETITYIGSVDGGAEAAGHADVSGTLLKVGGAALVRQLVHAHNFRVRYTPSDNPSLVALNFDMRGLAAAVAEMNGACGAL